MAVHMNVCLNSWHPRNGYVHLFRYQSLSDRVHGYFDIDIPGPIEYTRLGRLGGRDSVKCRRTSSFTHKPARSELSFAFGLHSILALSQPARMPGGPEQLRRRRRHLYAPRL